MGIDGLIISFGLFGLGILLGYLYGFEKEQSRINEAFRSENYNYESFLNVLEKYEKEKEAIKYWAKQEKKKSKKTIILWEYLTGYLEKENKIKKKKLQN